MSDLATRARDHAWKLTPVVRIPARPAVKLLDNPAEAGRVETAVTE